MRIQTLKHDENLRPASTHRRHVGRRGSPSAKRRCRFEQLENRLLLAARIIGTDADTSQLYATEELLIGFEKGRGGYTEVAMALNRARPGGWQALELSDSVFDDFPFAHLEFSSGADILAMADQLSRLAGVSYAEPNYIVSIDQTIPNDTSFSSLWGMNNTGQTGGTVDSDIDAPEAWDIQRGSTSSVVGIIDTGIDYTHPDLYLNVWINQGEIPDTLTPSLNDVDADGLITFWDLNDAANSGFVSDLNSNGYIDGGDLLADTDWADGSDGSDPLSYVDDLLGWDFVNNDNNPFDDNDHGTHVAGTIGGIGNNGIGVAGVNWQVQMIGLKFLNGGGSGTTNDAIDAVQYATAIGADLTSNSWGGGGFSTPLYDAIAASGDANMLFVAAAGNLSSNNDVSPEFPGSYDLPNIISVAATDHNDNYASFSSYGATTVDLAAPGVSILSSTPGGTYQSFNGTSMATPHVAGTAALLLAEAEDLGLTNVDYAYLKSVLLDSADEIGGTGITLTDGRLNAFSALGYMENDPNSPDDVTNLAVAGAGLSSVELTFTATGDDGATGTASKYDIRYSTSAIDTEALWAAATQATGEPDPLVAGTTETIVVSGLAPSTTYHFALKVRDNVGNETGLSNDSGPATTTDGTVIFNDNMELGVGAWAATGLWHQSNRRSNSTDTAWYYGQESSGTYNTGATNSGTLTHTIDLSDISEAILSYAEWSHLEEDSSYDLTQVQISDDGGAFNTVFESHGTDDAWLERTVDLNSYVGGFIDVRFSFDTIDNFENNYEGWYIDDVKVIAEPDGPSIKVSPISGLQTDEGGGAATFDVWLSEAPASGETVTIDLSSSDPSEGVADQTSLEFTDTNWDQHQTVTVTGVDDSEDPVFVDGDITYTIVTADAVSSDQNSEFNGLVAADVSVTNLDLDVGLSIDDISLDEGDSGTKDFVFTVSLSSDRHTSQVTVDYTTADGTATSALPDDIDYVSKTDTLSFAVGETSKTITISVNGDNDIEPDETFLVNLTNASSNATIPVGEETGTGTIIDDDVPRLSIDDVTVIEGNSGTSIAQFTVSLLKTSGTDITVGYATADDTATAGDDYEAKSGTMTIPANTLSGTIDVTIYGDTIDDEGSETFFVNLSNPSSGTIVDGLGIGLIGNDDAPPIQIIDNNTADTGGFSRIGFGSYWTNQGYADVDAITDVHQNDTEGRDVSFYTFSVNQGQQYQVSATWTANGNRAYKAPYRILDGGAEVYLERVNQQPEPRADVMASGRPFQHLGGPLAFSSGTLVVELSDDLVTGFVIADAIRIEAVGPGVTITETGGSTNVNEQGATTDTYSVVLNAAPAADETVTIDLGFDTNQISTVLKDHSGATIPSLTFTSSDWNLPKTVEVSAVDDGDIEGSHSVIVTHTASSTDGTSAYNGVSVSPVTVNITDDDTATVSIDANDPSAAEPSDNGQFTVTMSAASTVDTVINYNVTGTAGAGSDYTTLTGSVTVLANQPDATIDVDVIDNSVFENDETVIVTLTSTNNASVTVDSANDTATVTIADNEPGVRITPTTVNISEQGSTSESYDVLLATQPSGNVAITVTPDSQVDLGAGQGVAIVLNFTTTNWNAAKPVTVTAFDDAVDEGNHTSVITHSASGADPLYDNTLVIDSVTANISDNDAPPIQIIDNNTADTGGFSRSGSWSYWTTQGYADVSDNVTDVHQNAGGGLDVSFFTFSVNPGQQYQVSATWTAHGNRATNVPYRILDGGVEVYSQLVNQQPEPVANVTVSGRPFQNLGDPLTSSTDTLVVELSDSGVNGYVIADSIRIEAVGPGVTITESGGNTNVTEGGATDSYEITLNSLPTNPVEITVAADAQSLVSLDGSPGTFASSVIFTRADQSAQTIYVQAYDDSEIEGNHLSTITHEVTSTGSDYDGISINSVIANITDNDSAAPTLQIEHGVITVGTSGASVNLNNTYVSPVVITTPNYDQALGVPAVARLKNVTSTSFDVELVNPNNNALVAGNVHYIVVEEGVYTATEHGVDLEAVKYTSTVTDENNSWVGESRSYLNPNGYSNPVVLGQVMTSNDPDWSVFWSRGSSRTAPANGSLYVGKHVGQDPDVTRNAETIGYLVIESGSGTLDGIEFEAGVGADIVQSVTNAPPYNYTLTDLSSPDTAIVTQSAMDGGDGSWALLYGAAPLGASSIQVAVDEDQLADTERNHTAEQLAYLVLKDNVVVLPTVSIGDAVAVTEGDSGPVNASFNVTLSALPASGTATVNYNTANGTAFAEGDYASQSGTLTFNDTTPLTQTINIVVNGDLIDEDNETFYVNLSSPVDATITDGMGLGTINDDDDPPTVTLAATPAIAEAGGVATFTATLSQPSSFPVTVNLGFSGDATPIDDYVESGTQIVISSGTTGSVTVTAQPDSLDEFDETVIAEILTVINGTEDGTQTATTTITDDDAAPTISINDVSVTEGDNGTTNAVFTVSLSAVSGKDVTVDWTTADGSATAGSDYTATSGTSLTIPAGSLTDTTTISVPVIGDEIDEGDETFNVNLSNATNALNATATGTGTITNDDVAGVTVSKTDVYVSEQGETSEIYTVVLTSQPTGDVTIDIADVTQVTVSTTTLTFDSSNWSDPQPVTVTAVDDDVDEGFHTILIRHTASGADYGGVTVADVTANITDNDAPPAAPVQIIDNHSDNTGGFSRIGFGSHWTNQGYAGGDGITDVHQNSAAVDVATWTFSGLPPGQQYQVSATWTAHGTNRATNAPYRILGTTDSVPPTTTVNQRITPLADAVNFGTKFQNLGSPVTVDSSGTLVVELTDNGANGYVIADAVRIETLPLSGPKLEVGLATDDDGSDDWAQWQTVTLPHTYASMVVVATVDYGAGNNVPMVARVDNASGDSFDVRVERTDGGVVPAGVTVHYLAVEEGVYTLAEDGIQMEATRFNSTITDRRGSWSGQSRSYNNSYTNPVVVGQVMTANDVDWSVFWAHGSNRGSIPSASTLYVGKHVAEDTDTTRANEEIGYVVIETGSGSIPGYDYQAAVGSDSVQSSSNNSNGYAYSLNSGLTSPTTAIVSSAAMDGNDGAWPVLYGSDPLTASALNLIVDEDQIRDSERSHTTEQVAYLVFESTTSQSAAQSSLAAPAALTATPAATEPVESSRDNIGTVDSKSAKLKDTRAASKSASNSAGAPVSAAADVEELASVKRVDEALLQLLSTGEL